MTVLQIIGARPSPHPNFGEAPDAFDRWGRRLWARLARPATLWRRWQAERLADQALALDYQDMDAQAFAETLLRVRAGLARRATRQATLPLAVALVREATRRTLGLSHHRVQLIAGAAMIGGAAIEMRTGEGKTLSALIPAAIAGLMREPVHVVTTNDYLAARDAAQLAPVHRLLGLTCGAIQHEQDRDARRAIYACDIVHASNKELAFDYLRDRLILRGRVPTALALRPPVDQTIMAHRMGLCIVDEADSVLIDEARTPLILSRSVGFEKELEIYSAALALARGLRNPEDFTLIPRSRTCELSPQGEQKVDLATQNWGGIWQSRMLRRDILCKALQALHGLERDVHYLVTKDSIGLVDEFTGRILEGRSWSDGLHQLVELKENCTPTAPTVPAASITFQRFFRLYPQLTGMSGTLAETRGEIAQTYRLATVRIPTHRPSRLRRLKTKVFATEAAKTEAIAIRAAALTLAGRPVLIGCRSVLSSAKLSRALQDRAVPHATLNAAQDASEAAIIADAGTAGQVTVATNMAGRGTDILPDVQALDSGGLHVILSERHDARRIDRQLEGRSGRQGNPGTAEAFLSLEDDLFPALLCRYPVVTRALAATALGRGLTVLIATLSQRRREAQQRRVRQSVARAEDASQQMLAFAGEWE